MNIYSQNTVSYIVLNSTHNEFKLITHQNFIPEFESKQRLLQSYCRHDGKMKGQNLLLFFSFIFFFSFLFLSFFKRYKFDTRKIKA